MLAYRHMYSSPVSVTVGYTSNNVANDSHVNTCKFLESLKNAANDSHVNTCKFLETLKNAANDSHVNTCKL